MEFKEIIEKIISLPGHFLLFDDKNNNKRQKTPNANNVFLDMFKEREKAEIVLSVFTKSKNNSMDLLNEAKILLEKQSYARAVALAIMSYEELGKSQIAADYYSGVLPEAEYKKAFKKHENDTTANSRTCVPFSCVGRDCQGR